ncbi:MAG: flagellar M-ring protein FliF [Candidatus Sericytochromatia bacterium]|nr:flagellar M-ring protein FliF [Candidatus Sericytochromatia bacterium]
MAVDDQEEGGGAGLGFWGSLPPNRRILVVVAAIGIIALVVALAVMASRGGEDKYVTVYSKLSSKDVGETVDRLKELNIDYKVIQEGSAIAIERTKVDEARIALAMKGLPKDGVVGYEIFDKGSFISTDFEKRVSLQRAVNGELSRLIRKMDGVQDARVTVVMPEQALFAEQQQPPTAAVMVSFSPGGGFRPENVEAMTHLIASSVQGLKPDNVTVVDQAGNMLAAGQGSQDKNGDRGLNKEVSRRMDIQHDMEKDMETRTTALLEKVVGPGKAKVRVSLDMNWDRTQVRQRRMKPVTIEGQTGPVPLAKREMVQVNKTGGATSKMMGGGAPGATSNNPITANYQGTMMADASDSTSYAGTTNTQETYNFDNEETLTNSGYGKPQRMTVAALIQVNQDTQNITQDQLSKIVKAAVGEDPNRKDNVTVELVNFDTSVVDKLREEMEKAARERNPVVWAILIGFAGAVVGGGIAYAIAGRKKPPPAGTDQFGGLAAAGGPGMGGLAAIPAGAAPIPGAVPGIGPGGMQAEMPQDRVEISRAAVAPMAPTVADNPFAFLHNVGAETVAQLLSSERLPTLVAVLAQLSESQAQRVIDLLSPEIQREVQHRLEQNPILPPMTQKMVSQSLKKRLAGLSSGVT